ncbi:hypothetical protein ACVXZ4_14600 [Lacisediminihabitans sp. FW035]
MFKINKATYVVLAGAIAASIVGASVTSAQAAPVPTGSVGPVYFLDANNGQRVAAGTHAWDSQYVASPNVNGSTGDVTSPNEVFVGPSDAESAVVFLAPIGSEGNKSLWKASHLDGFQPGTKNVWLPRIDPSSLTDGTPAAVKAAGGDYSIGIAFLKNNGVTLISPTTTESFATIHITAGTGAYTFDVPDGPVVVTPPSGSFDQNLSVTTTAAVDGALNLISPANATTTFGAAVLDPITKLSTSTATLGNFSVQDDRVVSHPGWTLTSTVANFVSGTNTIDKKQLGITPKVVTANGTGATAGSAQVAGSAVYPAAFASADASPTVGTTVLGADLKFVAPATAPAGTYTSKLTITLASK